MIEVVTSVLILTASAFLVLAALGIHRMPDLYSRLGAATKAVALGGGLMFAAVAVHFGDIASDARAVAGIVFLLITAPVTAHVIARSGFHLGIDFVPWTTMAVDPSEVANALTEETVDQ